MLDQPVNVVMSLSKTLTLFEVRPWPLQFLNVIGISSFIFNFNHETCCYITMRSSTVENGIHNTIQQVRSHYVYSDGIVAAVAGCSSVTIFIG